MKRMRILMMMTMKRMRSQKLPLSLFPLWVHHPSNRIFLLNCLFLADLSNHKNHQLYPNQLPLPRLNNKSDQRHSLLRLTKMRRMTSSLKLNHFHRLAGSQHHLHSLEEPLSLRRQLEGTQRKSSLIYSKLMTMTKNIDNCEYLQY